MDGTAVAEEALRIGLGVEAQRFHARHARGGEAGGDIAFEIELMMPVATRREEAVVVRIGLGEAAQEGVVDLVAAARDRWADGGGNAGAVGAQPLHRLQRRLGHPGESTLPTGMGGADHAGLLVGEQHRGAIGGENAEGETGPVGDQRVCLGRALERNAVGDQRVGADHLVGDELAGETVVEGEGVVGEQPVLAPGDVHEYESFCVLRGRRGSMAGWYEFRRTDGSTFRAVIPRFELEVGGA